jgi:hypothetical protein
MRSIDRVTAIGLGMLATLEVNQEKWRDELRDRWVESKKLPRKKKKQERKSLLLEFSVASWSPYDDLGNWK